MSSSYHKQIENLNVSSFLVYMYMNERHNG